jgi:hypothetical protein
MASMLPPWVLAARWPAGPFPLVVRSQNDESPAGTPAGLSWPAAEPVAQPV